jgi:hypothetical protein
MRKMRVMFVEDDAPDIRQVKKLLRTTDLIQVDQVGDYTPLTDTTVANTDLFVLDVLIGRDPRQFVDFVYSIAWKKPFIAFTRVLPKGPIDTRGGKEQLREFVYANGAMGLVCKSAQDQLDPERHWHMDMQYELVERILTFYWSVHNSFA